MYINCFPCERQISQYYEDQLPMYPLAPIGSTLPTGMPAGQSISQPPVVPYQAIQQSEVVPQTVQDVNYLPGFLSQNVGKRVRVEFLIGTNAPLVDRTGTLLKVGANYILLQLADTDDIVTADLYAIKFVTIFR